MSIVGHTAAGFVPSRSEYGAFDLSADRANAVRQILEREGLPPSHIFAVSGKADSQPLFPDDPSLPANRRVTITLMREDPPVPPDLRALISPQYHNTVTPVAWRDEVAMTHVRAAGRAMVASVDGSSCKRRSAADQTIR